MNVSFPRRELAVGIPVVTEDGEVVGNSQTAAKIGIAQVVFSRIVMAVPGMGKSVLLLNVVHARIEIQCCFCMFKRYDP